ncbi:MAG TPA: hypothetical protein P5080_00145 [Candidatus Paceibacterota bacterium]|nr:hypothetical protein [Candidatus Pacearchaeota archaeon]HRZ50384.1 hypothetical protein [Candidatus Paceibacterota bacterium]HSA36105.1 hypothetical protein [Candidatus Paceibacterota bacterium]
MNSNRELNPRIDFPFIELNEIKIKLGAAQSLVAGFESQARSKQGFLIYPFSGETADYLKFIVKDSFSLDSCQLARELIAFGVERRITRLSCSLAERKYPRDDPDALLGELHEVRLQVAMLYSRIGIVEHIIASIEERIASAELKPRL